MEVVVQVQVLNEKVFEKMDVVLVDIVVVRRRKERRKRRREEREERRKDDAC